MPLDFATGIPLCGGNKNICSVNKLSNCIDVIGAFG
ncbi:hypothetical protein SCG7086_BN_00130 [Chlamydiales bacterium SCGC AG-110-P3]|nr:hypothetical protein SCG7086_BN_00130 [Chlamydiales bacterium SCGC AG-110-P3]